MHHTNFVFNNFLLGFPKLLHYELFANVWNAEAHILWVKFGDVQHLGINGTGWIMIKKICFPLSMAPRNWYGYAIRWGVVNWHEFPLQWRCWLEKILCVSAAVLQFYFLTHIVFFFPLISLAQNTISIPGIERWHVMRTTTFKKKNLWGEQHCFSELLPRHFSVQYSYSHPEAGRLDKGLSSECSAWVPILLSFGNFKNNHLEFSP